MIRQTVVIALLANALWACGTTGSQSDSFDPDPGQISQGPAIHQVVNLGAGPSTTALAVIGAPPEPCASTTTSTVPKAVTTTTSTSTAPKAVTTTTSTVPKAVTSTASTKPAGATSSTSKGATPTSANAASSSGQPTTTVTAPASTTVVPLSANCALSRSLSVVNQGPSTASRVELAVPATGIVTIKPSQGECHAEGDHVVCNLGDLAPGASATLAIGLNQASKKDTTVSVGAQPAGGASQKVNVRLPLAKVGG